MTRTPRLAHGWQLVRGPGLSDALVREFIRPAVRAVPSSLARRLGACRISLPGEVAAGVASRWTMTDGGLEVSVTTEGIEDHDIAMELLLCLGQALWEKLSDAELRAYWILLSDEIGAGIEGEIDEQALDEKRSLLNSRSHATSLQAAGPLWPCVFRRIGGRVRSLPVARGDRQNRPGLPARGRVAAASGTVGAVVPAGPRLPAVPRRVARRQLLHSVTPGLAGHQASQFGLDSSASREG